MFLMEYYNTRKITKMLHIKVHISTTRVLQYSADNKIAILMIIYWYNLQFLLLAYSHW